MKNFIYFPGITAKAILVMSKFLEGAFLISLDYGSRKTPAKIKTPKNDYLEDAPHAIIKNVVFIFGGLKDKQKVRKLYKPRE